MSWNKLWQISRIVGFFYVLPGSSYLSCLPALSLQRGSFPCRVPALSPGGDKCATCAKQDDPRLIPGAEGEIDFCAHVKGDRLQFHKTRLGEAHCMDVLQEGEDSKALISRIKSKSINAQEDFLTKIVNYLNITSGKRWKVIINT